MTREELIKQLITNIGLSLRAFAQKADLPYSTLRSMLERGINNASVDNVLKLCKALDISFEDLDEMTRNNSLIPLNKDSNKKIDTLAAHLEGKDLTPQKMKLLEKYIDALFDDED